MNLIFELKVHKPLFEQFTKQFPKQSAKSTPLFKNLIISTILKSDILIETVSFVGLFC